MNRQKKNVNSCLVPHKGVSKRFSDGKKRQGSEELMINFIIVPASSDEYMINARMNLILKKIVIRHASSWFAYAFFPYKKTPTNQPITTKTPPNQNP